MRMYEELGEAVANGEIDTDEMCIRDSNKDGSINLQTGNPALYETIRAALRF